jgi:hypothetical protein
METQELFAFAHARVLRTRVYRGTPDFPDEVEKSSTLSGLIFWLGSTPFPPDHPGEAAAIGELLVILTSFDLTLL